MSATSRSLGNIDMCHAERGAGRAGGRAVVLPGDRIRVAGWAATGASTAPAFTAVAGERRSPLALVERNDALAAHGSAAGLYGFEGWVTQPEADGGPFDVRVFARSGGGSEVQVGETHRFCSPVSPLTEIPETSGYLDRGRIRLLADTRPEPFPDGWRGRRSIRPGAAVEILGWVLDETGLPASEVAIVISGRDRSAAFPATPIFDGEANVVARTTSPFRAGFRCLVDPEPFPPGLYDGTVVARTRTGWMFGPSTAFQIPPRVAEIAPIFLPIASEVAPAAVERLQPADPLRGEPISVEGWALDPATDCGGDVFVVFDDGHPLPVASRIARPDVRTSGDRAIGFGGIADTADVEPGPHRLRILLRASCGALWHLLAEREVAVR